MWDKATSNIFGTSVELLPDGLEAGVYSEGNDMLCMNKKTPKRSKKSKNSRKSTERGTMRNIGKVGQVRKVLNVDK